jgi:hypothetical protein
LLDRIAKLGVPCAATDRGAHVPDDAWAMARLRRLMADRLPRSGDECVGWAICSRAQFLPPIREPTQDAIDR